MKVVYALSPTVLLTCKLGVMSAVFALFLGCGGGNELPAPERSQISSSSSSLSSSSSSSSSSSTSSSGSSGQDAVSVYDPTVCDDFSASLANAENNIYQFFAPAGNCVGIVGDGAYKKTMPLRTNTESVESVIAVGDSIKLYRTTKEFRWQYLYITFDLTNTTENPLCFIDGEFEYIYLFDSEGNEIAMLDGTGNFVEGDLYALSVVTTNTCIAPGKTLRYAAQTQPIPDHIMDIAVYAEVGEFDGIYFRAEALPTMTVVDFNVINSEIFVSFVNDTQTPIDFSSTFPVLAIFSEDGYFVGDDYLRLTESEDEIVESGDMFELGAMFPRYARTSNGVEVVVYLDWEYLR